jgi:hypothetical protein
MQTGTFGYFVPNCSKIDKLSMYFELHMLTSSISSRETPLSIKYFFQVRSLHANPNCNLIETVSKPEPISLTIEVSDV